MRFALQGEDCQTELEQAAVNVLMQLLFKSYIYIFFLSYVYGR